MNRDAAAVIGEDEADKPPPSVAPKEPRKPAPSSAAHPPAPVLVRITSSPLGAVVRTKKQVLGRTPISLHFRGGNTYELMFVKQGYAATTKRVTLASAGAKDRKVAVVLKKNRTPAGRPSLFHLHR